MCGRTIAAIHWCRPPIQVAKESHDSWHQQNSHNESIREYSKYDDKAHLRSEQ